MSTFSNDEVEQLRVRYRQQALKAVEEAEKRAYEKGQADARQQLDEELSALRNDNKALKAVVQSYREQAEAQQGSKPQMRPLLRHIMEQVYGETKKRFDKSATFTGEQVVSQMKAILVAQAEALAQSIGDLPILAVKPPVQAPVQSSPPQPGNAGTSAGAAAAVPHIVTDGSTATPSHSPTQDPARRLHAHPESPKHSLVPDSSSIAKLLSVKEDLPNPAAAIFREFATTPSLDIVVAIKGVEKHDAGVFGTFATYEMHSAVMHVQSMAKKPQYYSCSHRYRDFDNLHAQLKKLVPHAMLPSLPPKDISVGNNLRDDFVQTRRRGLRLWMQHVSMHPELQRCPTLAQFVCGGRVPQSWPVDVNMVVSKPSRMSQRIRLGKSGSGSGKSHHRMPSLFREEPSDTVTESAVPMQTEADRERANRLLLTVSKNYAAMQQPIKAALEATSKLLSCMQDQAAARQELHAVLCQFSVSESRDKQIQAAISGVAQAIGKSATKYSQTETVLLSHLHQPLVFYGVNCMQAAKACIEHVSGMERDQKVDAATDLVGEWVTLRQLRHAYQLRDLTSAAEGMLELHAGLQEAWQEVMATIGPPADLSPRGLKTSTSWTETVRRHSQMQPHHDYLTAFHKRYSSTDQPPLVHPAESKPIVPPGIRQLPEKIFTSMRDYLAKQTRPDIRPVPDSTPSVPPTYRSSSEPYIDPFMDSPYQAASRRIPTGTTPVPPMRHIIDPFAARPSVDESASTTAIAAEKARARADKDARNSASEPAGRGATERRSSSHHHNHNNQQQHTETKAAAPASASAAGAVPAHGRAKSPSAAPAPETAASAGVGAATREAEEETLMSKLYKERAAAWEREQEAARQRQREELMEQIRQEKELNDDIADRRRRARANAQTKHAGQATRLRKPTKKQAAVPQQEEYVPPAPTRPVNYANYTAPLSSSLFDDHARHWEAAAAHHETAQQQQQQARSTRTDSSPPRPEPSLAAAVASAVAGGSGGRRASAPEAAQPRPSMSSPRPSLSDEQFECEPDGPEGPLPEGWEEVYTADGKRYYYHKLSRVSRWERPTKELADKVAERYYASQKAVDDAVERRRREREEELREQEQRAQRAAELKSRIRAQVVAWSKNKPMYLMLKECNSVVPFITIDAATAELTGSSGSADVKKGYLKIVRQIHPDKLTGMELEQQILAEEVFTVLTEAFEKFRGSA